MITISIITDSPFIFHLRHLKIQHAYKTYMTTIARLLGGGSDSEKKMMRIYNFERDLAIVSYGSGRI